LEELACLKYVQRRRKYINRQLLVASPTDTDESKPEKIRGGGRIMLLMTMYFRRSRSRQKS
ncbi:MAG: hypothetical protein ACKPKO_22700, partial [Candidatus Fonsibacter sp.]